MTVETRSGAGRVLLLVGAAHGIGRAIAAQAAARGFSLALCDIDAAGLDAVAVGLPAGDHIARRVDVTSLEAVTAFAAEAIGRWGGIDSAVCNAGGMVSLVVSGRLETSFKPFIEVDPGDWRSIIDLNLIGALNVSRAVLPSMVERGSGRLVLVSSASALFGAAGLAVYSAAKGGVIALTKALAREVGGAGVTVNSVAPGGIATRAFPAGAATGAKRTERIAAGRLGTPEEVANVVVYLADDAPPYLSGEVISVSGGPP